MCRDINRLKKIKQQKNLQNLQKLTLPLKLFKSCCVNSVKQNGFYFNVNFFIINVANNF